MAFKQLLVLVIHGSWSHTCHSWRTGFFSANCHCFADPETCVLTGWSVTVFVCILSLNLESCVMFSVKLKNTNVVSLNS